jgi:hypothetical protein
MAILPRNNPLDTLFDIEQEEEQSDIIEYDQVTEGELQALAAPGATEKDEEDKEIDVKIDNVYTAAMETFQNQMAYTEIIEPRYAARNAEVAASYLNIALNAATQRARVKGDRKRIGTFIPQGGRVTNNTIVATRDEIMRMITVDADTKEV